MKASSAGRIPSTVRASGCAPLRHAAFEAFGSGTNSAALSGGGEAEPLVWKLTPVRGIKSPLERYPK